MYRTLCKTTVFALMLALTLAPRGIAQQQQHQEHHPGGTPASQEQPAVTDEGKDAEGGAPAPRMEQMQRMMQQMQGMMQQMRSIIRGGMMGGGMMGPGGRLGGMLQRHLA